jgi:hypothetical protein
VRSTESRGRDVHEVMRSATMKARPEQTFVLYLEHHMDDDGPGLTRLVGQDLNRSRRRWAVAREGSGSRSWAYLKR